MAKRLSIRLPENLENEIRIKTDKTGKTVSKIVREALNEYFYGVEVNEK